MMPINNAYPVKLFGQDKHVNCKITDVMYL